MPETVSSQPMTVNPATLTLLRDLVLIRLSRRETRGNIALPDEFAEWNTDGVVCNVGPGRITRKGTLQPVLVTPGQHVVFQREYAAFMFDERDGRGLCLVPSDYVEAVVPRGGQVQHTDPGPNYVLSKADIEADEKMSVWMPGEKVAV
jgi:co-chaperonin GroES (HSP10)